MATTRKKLRHGSNFLIVTISLAVILIVVNVVSSGHFVRWDLTENREYTISPVTRELLGSLDDVVNIKVFLSKDLPAALLVLDRQLRDLLTEFEQCSNGKLRIKYIAPVWSQETEQKMRFEEGVQPQQVASFTGDSAEQKIVYNSIVIQHGNRKEIIPSLVEPQRGGLSSDFEYLFVSKIAKVQRAGNKVVGWAANAPDLDLRKAFNAVRQAVQAEWDIFDVRIDSPARIRDDVAVLILVSPRDMSPAQQFEIDQYLMRGGKLLVLADTYQQNVQQGSIAGITARPSNFMTMLRHYGLRVDEAVVLDPNCNLAFAQGGFPQPYPFWVNVLQNNFRRDNRAVAKLGKITLPWTQPLDATASKPAGVKYTPLAWSSRYSLIRTGPNVPLTVGRMPKSEWDRGTTRTLVAALSGKFPSFFPKDLPIPADGATTASAGERTAEKDRRFESPETQIMVVGNSLFAQDDFLRTNRLPGNTNNNAPFLLNSIEWLAEARGLGQIRARAPLMRPLKTEIANNERNTYKVVGAFAMPLAVVILGVMYNVFRRQRRRAVARHILEA
jgi:gliding-associated putative ABC transporter substrate-binding component GldG